jgi:hypothetical protein
MKLIKTCKNPECGIEILEYKSSKRSYCDATCKNRASYIKKTVDEAHLLAMDKAMRNNYKVLKKLSALDLGGITHQTLKSHGFDFDAIHKAEPKLDDNGVLIQLNHIYDIYFEIKEKLLIIRN